MSKILNFGSLNRDMVYQVDHMVRDGETLSSQGYQTFPGGKGLNQSIALSLAGGQVSHAGKVGPDGMYLLELLRSKGVDISLVAGGGSVTGHAIIQVNTKGQNCILIHGGANTEITENEVANALAGFGPGDILLLQNEVNGIEGILRKGYEKGMRVALNPSPIGEAVHACELEKVTWLLLNEVEGEALTGRQDPDAMVQALRSRYPAMRVVLTLGKRGVLYDDGAQRHTHGIYKVPVVDTTAAGDTFTGYFLSCAEKGLPVPECLRLASVASSLAVSKAGAAVSIPTWNEVVSSTLTPE